MRYFLTTVALAATIAVAGVAKAQGFSVWYTDNFGAYADSRDFNDFGLERSTLDFQLGANPAGAGSDAIQDITNFYFAGSTGSVTTFGATEVANFWATTDSIDEIKTVFKLSQAQISPDKKGDTIANFNLQVGNRSLGIIAGTERNFGVSMADTPAGAIELTNNSVKYGETTIGNGTWGISDTSNTQFSVRNDGIISNVRMDGGSLVNNSRVEELTYYSGNYFAGENGSIGKLLVGSTDNLNNIIGPVESAALAEGGNGIITITGTGDYNDVAYEHDFGIDVTGDIDFTGFDIDLKLSGVDDFADWVGAGNEFAIDFAGVFGIDTVTGIDDIASFDLFLGDATEAFFNIISEETLLAGWSYIYNTNNVATGFAYQAAPGDNAVPEPATLAVLGLGLAGLGMASRRRRK